MTKILHTADIHIQETGDERWQALLEVLKTADKEEVDVLTISGDLFDKDLNAHEIRDELRAVFSKQDYQVIILPGNHDSRSYQQGLYFGDNVTLINDFQQQIDVQDATFTGIPFEPLDGSQLIKRLEMIDAELDENRVNVLLFHGELTDIFFNKQDFGDEGDKRYLPLKLNLLENTKFDYILAGHFHTNFVKQRLPNQRLDQGGFFVYPGSPVSITSKETGKRSTALIKTGQSPQQKTVDTHHFKNIKITLTPDKDSSLLINLEKEMQNLKPNAAGIIFVDGYFDSGKLGLNETQLKKQISALGKKYDCRLKEKHYKAKEVGPVLNSGLFQTFTDRLQTKEVNGEEKERLQKTLIQAMTRVNA